MQNKLYFGIFASLLVVGCGTKETEDTGTTDTEDTEVEATLDIIGSWEDNWGSMHEVSDTTWDDGYSLFNIASFDNDAGWLIAQNDSSNLYNPDLWSKFEWAYDADGELHYCQSTYDAADEQAAMDAAGADATDFDAGCNGFSWSKLRAPLGFTGDYDDSWGVFHVVNPWSWMMDESSFHVSTYEDGWLVAQNDSSNAYNPDLWSKFEWAYDADGAAYYCQSTYDAADEQAAMDAAGADAADLDVGCNGSPWSALRTSLGIRGSYTDNWGYSHTADAWTWEMDESIFHISQYDNWDGWAIAQNDSSNAYSPDLWSKFEWTYDADSVLYYCQSTYDAADEQAAMDAAGADAADLDVGCNGSPWSILTAE